MTRHQTVLFRQFLTFLDVLISAALFWAAHVLRAELPRVVSFLPPWQPDPYSIRALVLMLPVWTVAFSTAKTSDFRASYGRVALRFGRATGTALVVLIIASFWFKLNLASRSFVALFGAMQFVGLLVGRVAVMETIRRIKKVNDHRILIVGCGDQAMAMAQALHARAAWNNRFLGYVSVPQEVPRPEAQPLLGQVSELAIILDETVVDEVMFVVPGRSVADFAEALAACDQRGVEVLITMPPAMPRSGNVELNNTTGFNMPMLGLTRTPVNEAQLFTKRVLDVVGATLGIVLASPIMLIAAAAIKLSDGGPVLVRQVRTGRGGRSFAMLKFRSVHVGPETSPPDVQPLHPVDAEATAVGRWMRRTSIDELPQLFNVLVGAMSLVGPRPPLPTEYSDYEPWQRRRLSVRPGMTGVWQVASRRGTSSAEEWMKQDLDYIDSWSIWLDLKILARSVPAVFSGRGPS